MHNRIRTYTQKHRFPLRILAVTLKDVLCPPAETLVPEISSLLSDLWQNTAARQLASELKKRRKREVWRDALFLTFLGHLCLFASLPPPHREDYCPESFSQQSLGCNQRSDRTRMTLTTQHCHHNGGTDYEKHPAAAERMNTAEYRQESVSENMHVWACASFALTLFPAALLTSLEGSCARLVCASSISGFVDFSVGLLFLRQLMSTQRGTINHTNLPTHSYTRECQT